MAIPFLSITISMQDKYACKIWVPVSSNQIDQIPTLRPDLLGSNKNIDQDMLNNNIKNWVTKSKIIAAKQPKNTPFIYPEYSPLLQSRNTPSTSVMSKKSLFTLGNSNKATVISVFSCKNILKNVQALCG